MEWYTMLQRAIDYMEEHLLEEIHYEDVARQVHMSSYEFHRTFSCLSGMTANTYIRNRRLSLAGKELMETGAKVTDMAFKYGYETPESFTKAFTKFHGIAPKYAKDAGVQLTFFPPLVIKITMEGGKMMDYRMERTEEKKFIALVRAFPDKIINDEENQEIPCFWSECQEKKLLEAMIDLRPEGKRDLYGLCSPTKKGESTFYYGIGVLADEDTRPFDEKEILEAGYQLWTVEPGEYAVFECMGEDSTCISQTWARFYKEFLPQMGYEASEATDYEIYFERGKEGLFCELWIPIKKLY